MEGCGMIKTKLSQCSVDEIANSYLGRRWPKNEDPVNDCMRIIEIAGILGCISDEVVLRNTEQNPYVRPAYEKALDSLIEWTATICAMCCPDFDRAKWIEVIHLIFAGRYGGTKVYIKTGKKISKSDASRLTPKQIMESYGVSRAYAYRLLRRK